MGAAHACLIGMVHSFRSLLLLCIAASLVTCAPAPPETERSASSEQQPAAPAGSARHEEPERAPAQVVEALGARLDMVSILAPPDAVARAMRDSWGALVDPPLLERWIADPADSPGRATSSPRPDRIEVGETVMLAGDRAVVTGMLVESTSSGDSTSRPVRIELGLRDDRWMITSFAIEPAARGEDAADAVAVIEDYYAAIAGADYRRAWSHWGPSGAPGQTFDQFAAGFASTENVRVTTGAPSRVEGAAGSRYVEIPVTIEARQKNGSERRFEGSYTLRRSVVDGAAPASRRWHIHEADLRSAAGPQA